MIEGIDQCMHGGDCQVHPTVRQLHNFDPQPMTYPAPILLIRVHGTARPKGSLRHVGKGRMVEQLDGSPEWRRTVAAAAYEAIEYAAGYPYTGPVKAIVRLTFPTPKSAKAGAMP